MSEFIVSARKYRPQTFSTVVGQQGLMTTLKNAITGNRLAHAYLFCGPRGVGKTTSARIFAKTINCLNPTPDHEACGECESCKAMNENRSFNIHELDAASNNTVDEIRKLIAQVNIPPQIGRYSVFIIDEVHMLSSSAFNAFLKTLEEPPAHAIFILATTEKHKILPTILSRCQCYDFNRMSVQEIVNHLKFVAEKEGVSVDEEALNVIAIKSDGGMRDALSIFDQIVSFCGKQVKYEDVIKNLNVLDYNYYFTLTTNFLEGNTKESILTFDEIIRKGIDGSQFISGLCSHIRNLIMSKDEETIRLIEMAESIQEGYRTQSINCPDDFLYEALRITSECEFKYKDCPNKRLMTEVMLMRLCQLGKKKNSIADFLAEEEALTQMILEKIFQEPVSSENQVPKNVVSPQIPNKKNESPIIKANKNIVFSPSILGATNPVQTENLANNSSITLPENESNVLISKEKLNTVWHQYLVGLKNNQLLVQTLRAFPPKLLDDQQTIQLTVTNSYQKELIQENMLDMKQYLKHNLQNNLIEITICISEQTTQYAKTIEERFDELLNKNSELKQFFDMFELYS